MVRVYEDPIEEDEKNKRSCDGLRQDLKACIMETSCVTKDRLTPKECLLSRHPSIPDECYALRYAFFECKRSTIDPRQRFRGKKGY